MQIVVTGWSTDTIDFTEPVIINERIQNMESFCDDRGQVTENLLEWPKCKCMHCSL